MFFFIATAKILGMDDEEAHCCRIEESSIINIIITCDISIYSSSYIVNCADKYKLQITNKTLEKFLKPNTDRGGYE